MHYPAWICTDCAVKNKGKFPKGHIATWHIEECGWCHENKAVTEPKDYGFPRYESHKDMRSDEF